MIIRVTNPRTLVTLEYKPAPLSRQARRLVAEAGEYARHVVHVVGDEVRLVVSYRDPSGQIQVVSERLQGSAPA